MPFSTPLRGQTTTALTAPDLARGWSLPRCQGAVRRHPDPESWPAARLTWDANGILTGMTATTIKVPKRTRDRLHRLAKAEGLTLAQAIDKLIDEAGPRPRPSIGGFSSGQPLDAAAIDAELASGFGA